MIKWRSWEVIPHCGLFCSTLTLSSGIACTGHITTSEYCCIIPWSLQVHLHHFRSFPPLLLISSITKPQVHHAFSYKICIYTETWHVWRTIPFDMCLCLQLHLSVLRRGLRSVAIWHAQPAWCSLSSFSGSAPAGTTDRRRNNGRGSRCTSATVVRCFQPVSSKSRKPSAYHSTVVS